MNKLALDANKRLATLLGWTNIVDVGGALLGKPTWVCDNSRSQVQIPNWAGDWKDCGPLMVAHCVTPHIHKLGAAAACEYHYVIAFKGDHADRDAQTRYAIVCVVCAKLEAAQ